jgi:hypothetical protein
VSAPDLVPLRCGPETLVALSTGLTHYGPCGGTPDWLISAVWLRTVNGDFLATSTIEIQSDGYLARPLNIDRPSDLAAQVEADLPDIRGRLVTRGSHLDLPEGGAVPSPPADLTDWPAAPYSMSVLVRMAKRAMVTSRVACALLFASESAPAFIVGTDLTTWAMVLSENAALIERYRRNCDEMPLRDYRELAAI